ncbi:MBL fold metallo-hydrolase [Chloroflexota bacterium]
MLDITKLTLGPVQTNSYLIADTGSGEAAVIDPAWQGEEIFEAARLKSWKINFLWYTHAHFDHIGGAAGLAAKCDSVPLVALHKSDYSLWKSGGGGSYFGFKIDPGPEPGMDLEDQQLLKLGETKIKVLFTPGHTPGHCSFFSTSDSVLFSGDLIFQGSVGRTDFPGGSFDILVESIRNQVFTLPDDTRILSGHGPETNVGWEKRNNPFVNLDLDGRMV